MTSYIQLVHVDKQNHDMEMHFTLPTLPWNPSQWIPLTKGRYCGMRFQVVMLLWLTFFSASGLSIRRRLCITQGARRIASTRGFTKRLGAKENKKGINSGIIYLLDQNGFCCTPEHTIRIDLYHRLCRQRSWCVPENIASALLCFAICYHIVVLSAFLKCIFPFCSGLLNWQLGWLSQCQWITPEEYQ